MNQYQDYFKKLLELRKNAYVPYSNFRVACIIELHNKKEIHGVNVENAAYPATICGERTALTQLYAQGYTKNDVSNIYLITSTDGCGTPCGICRQVLSELICDETPIHIFNNKGYVKTILNTNLLPEKFSAEALNN